MGTRNPTIISRDYNWKLVNLNSEKELVILTRLTYCKKKSKKSCIAVSIWLRGDNWNLYLRTSFIEKYIHTALFAIVIRQ